MNERAVESLTNEREVWRFLIPALGLLLLLAAIGKSIVAFSNNHGLLEAGLDLLLLSAPGLVMLYIGLWLPSSQIDTRLHPRIVAWTIGGIVVMGIVLGLRVVHPGVEVQYTFGTQAVLLSIGSIAGLGIGIHEARAFTYARTLEDQKETLERTEQQLEEAVVQLEASNEQLEQFAYAASHDLQEPLRMVTSYLELIKNRYGGELDEECVEFIDFAVDGAERMSGMVDGLLEYSRVETQGEAFDAVDLETVLDHVQRDLAVKIEETDAEVTREPMPTVEGDERQLQQLFQNLLSNAIDYCGDDPPRVRLWAEEKGSQWAISVRDDGVGIDPAQGDRIFDIFQRAHAIDESAGSGIGLALCKRIVEHHNGEIWVESTPGDGSTFSFTLPESVDSPSDDPSLEDSALSPSSSRN